MLVLGFLGYLASGFVSLWLAVVIHMIKAESAGYDCLNWWKERISAEGDNLIDESFIIGMLLWPLRLTQFIIDIPNYYEEYGFKY